MQVYTGRPKIAGDEASDDFPIETYEYALGFIWNTVGVVADFDQTIDGPADVVAGVALWIARLAKSERAQDYRESIFLMMIWLWLQSRMDLPEGPSRKVTLM